MVEGGVELLAGVVQDAVFGPLVAFGPGGVLAELIGEAAFRIAPLTDVGRAELVAGGKAGRLVAGFRGAPAADAAALVDLVLRLALLGEERPAVAELDLNPILALPDRCVAVDARVRVQAPSRPFAREVLVAAGFPQAVRCRPDGRSRGSTSMGSMEHLRQPHLRRGRLRRRRPGGPPRARVALPEGKLTLVSVENTKVAVHAAGRWRPCPPRWPARPARRSTAAARLSASGR